MAPKGPSPVLPLSDLLSVGIFYLILMSFSIGVLSFIYFTRPKVKEQFK
jgi:hypothetical protein